MKAFRLALLLAVSLKLTAILAGLALAPLLPFQPQHSATREYGYRFEFGHGLPQWLTMWANFDGFYYLAIAKRGYYPGEVPFFPLYPLLVSWTQAVTRTPFILAGQITSFLALLGALYVTIKLVSLDEKPGRGSLVLAAMLLFPTSYSYTATYNDSLFYLLATLCLYLGRQARWLGAGIAGSLATLARLNGIALFPFLVAEYLGRESPRAQTDIRELLKNLRTLLTGRISRWWQAITILFVPITFLANLASLHTTFHSWTILFSAMKPWGQDKIIFPLQTVWRYIKIFFLVDPRQIGYWVSVAEIGFLLLYVAVLVWSWKRLRLSYWIFFAASILIPSLTGTFQGMPRYGLHLYPLFFALHLWLSERAGYTRFLYFVCCSFLLATFVLLFTHGFFIA